jgi:hypothetical protein
MIYFDEPNHIYTNKDGERYISATQFLEHFIISFEETEQFWLYYKAIQYLSDIPSTKIKKYDDTLNDIVGNKIFTRYEYNKIVSYALGSCDKDHEKLLDYFSDSDKMEIEAASIFVKNHWINENVKANVRGTAFHNWKEDLQLKEKLFNFKGYDIPVYLGERDFDLSLLEPQTYTELRLWNHKYKLAGTADQIIVLPEKKVIVRDWKTNKEIKVSNKYQNMKYPVSHLEDCNLNHYNLQLSLYGWMLEQFGFEVVHIEFEHFTLENVPEGFEIVGNKVYEIPYLKIEIENMLEHYKNYVQVYLQV